MVRCGVGLRVGRSPGEWLREGRLDEVMQVHNLVRLSPVDLLEGKDPVCELLNQIGEDSKAGRHVHRGPGEVGETQLRNSLASRLLFPKAAHLDPIHFVFPTRARRSRSRVLVRSRGRPPRRALRSCPQRRSSPLSRESSRNLLINATEVERGSPRCESTDGVGVGWSGIGVVECRGAGTAGVEVEGGGGGDGWSVEDMGRLAGERVGGWRGDDAACADVGRRGGAKLGRLRTTVGSVTVVEVRLHLKRSL